MDPVDIGETRRLFGEDDPLPIGGIRRRIFECAVRDQRPFVAAVCVGDHDREFLQPEAIEEDLVLCGGGLREPGGERQERREQEPGHLARVCHGALAIGRHLSLAHVRSHTVCCVNGRSCESNPFVIAVIVCPSSATT